MFRSVAPLAAKGWKLVRLYGVRDDGTCTCSNANCPEQSRGKHPSGGGEWQHRATSNEEEIYGWLSSASDQHNRVNIGVLLGPASGIIDVEFDSPEEEEVLREFGLDKIDTPAYTSGRGKHFIFQHESWMPDSAVVYVRKLGVRLGGGGKAAQSVLPPSWHRFGKRYQWLPGKSPEEVEPARLPESFREALLASSRGRGSGVIAQAREKMSEGKKVTEGGRHAYLLGVASDLAKTERNLSDPVAQGKIRHLVAVVNQADCIPPKSEDEVIRIANDQIKHYLPRSQGGAFSETDRCGDPPQSEKPVVWIADGEKPRVTDQSIAAIAGEVFQRGGQLVRCLPAGNGLKIAAVTDEGIDDLLNRRIEFRRVKIRKDGTQFDIVSDAPAWLSRNIPRMQKWDRTIRHLEGVHTGPFIRPDGSLGGLQSGYDKSSRCWVETKEDWQELASPVTAEQVAESVALLRSLVDEFPFRGESAFSAWLAAILTSLARPAIHGPCPLFVIQASTPGSGKSLLSKLAGIIATGESPGMLSLSNNDEETRKLITSALQKGESILVFDNVTIGVQSPSLDRFLTSTQWSDRLLGHTEFLTLPNQAVCILTKNNGGVSSDTCRRSLVTVLSPVEEKPEERSFRITDIEAYARGRRRELLIAAMRIVLRHVQQGKPEFKQFQHKDLDGNDVSLPVRQFGSFEAWGSVVRHAIIGAGLPDPVSTAAELEAVDEGRSACRRLLESWRDWNPDWRGTAKELCEILYGEKSDERAGEMAEAMSELLAERKKSGAGKPEQNDLGYVLRSIKGRNFANLKAESVDFSRGAVVWGLVSVDPLPKARGCPVSREDE